MASIFILMLLAIHSQPLHGFGAPKRLAAPCCSSRVGIPRILPRVQARASPTKRLPAFRVALFHKPYGVLSDVFETTPGDKWLGLSAFFEDSGLQPAGRLDANRLIVNDATRGMARVLFDVLPRFLFSCDLFAARGC